MTTEKAIDILSKLSQRLTDPLEADERDALKLAISYLRHKLYIQGKLPDPRD